MRLYLKYFSMHLRAAMQYKASFFLTAAGQFIVSFSAFLAIYFLFQRFHAVEGFRFEQVLLCYAVVLTAFALSECFFRGFDTFAGIIGNGEFDRILVRPDLHPSADDSRRCGPIQRLVHHLCRNLLFYA